MVTFALIKCYCKATLLDNTLKAVIIVFIVILYCIIKTMKVNGHLYDCRISPVQQGSVFSSVLEWTS